MGWMLDEFEKIKGRHEPAMITGKPLELGGIALRSDSTSKGGFIVLKEFLGRAMGQYNPADITVAVQGFGNAGMNIAKMLHEEGFNITAVSDSKGGVQNKNINIPDTINKKKEKGTVTECEGKKITNKELLELDVDILILAALENQVTKDNAENIKADYILELANGPVTSEADEILFRKEITVIPDILANAGGVVVSYFEWANNRSGNILDEDMLAKKLNEKMVSSFHRVYELYKEEGKLSMRAAAYVIAIKRILAAERARSVLNK
jgi:glutamate dehydrogenase/leucine dehydrogenase